MEKGGPIKGSPIVAQLAKLAHVLRDTEARRSFTEDPSGALARAGVDMEALPSSVVETLSSMSHDEIAAVIRFNDALIDAGLVVEGPDEPGPDQYGGRVGFF
jgi:hypothetical protein